MSWRRLYGRVLGLLGPDKRTGWWLAGGNLLLVSAVFAEPILFGRVIDVLINHASRVDSPSTSFWPLLSPLLIAWVLVGLFAIASGVLVALFADRLAHARRHLVLHQYFEHVLGLPLHHRDGQHSGRLMKIMLQGTDALWSLWLSFFRDHLAAFFGGGGSHACCGFFKLANGESTHLVEPAFCGHDRLCDEANRCFAARR